MTKRAAALPILLLFFFLSGCATVERPLNTARRDLPIETLATSVSLTIKTRENNTLGVRGYLVFRQPDRFHLALLSPFGLTLAEVFSDAERIICLVPSKNIAYSGRIDELPDAGGMKSWGMMRWVVERPPIEAAQALSMEHRNAGGKKEVIFFDAAGLMTRKLTEDGDEVLYNDYRAIDGVAFPFAISVKSNGGDIVRIEFDEPEVNKPLEEGAFTPPLEGVAVLPFSQFKGF